MESSVHRAAPKSRKTKIGPNLKKSCLERTRSGARDKMSGKAVKWRISSRNRTGRWRLNSERLKKRPKRHSELLILPRDSGAHSRLNLER